MTKAESQLVLEAPAKINLTLEVTGVEENGYHTLDTLFVWLDLHDTLELSKGAATSLEMLSDGADLSRVESDESNLVLRALRAVEKLSGCELPTRFRLTKRIPAGGGLGGGSADAAAALVGLRSLHELEISDQELHSVASRLGADVAFGLRGGFARGQRYGDLLTPLEFPADLEGRSLLLLAPGFPCPTPDVYKSWDAEPSQAARGATDRFLGAVGPERVEQIANDLEPAAFRLYGDLADLKRQMQQAGLEGVALSGSGSTLFGFLPIGESPEPVEKALSGAGRLVWTRLRKEKRGG